MDKFVWLAAISKKEGSVTLLDIVKSVVAGIFGVQSAKNRARDFQQQSIIPYIVVGIIFVALFVLGLYAIVSYVVV